MRESVPANKDAVETYEVDVTAAADTDAVVTLEAVAGEYHVIDGVHCSYKLGTGTTGKLTITFGGVTKHEVDITANGVYEEIWERGLYMGTPNEEVVITLAAGGTDVVGKVNVLYR